MSDEDVIKTQEFLGEWANGYIQRRINKLEKRRDIELQNEVVNLDYYKYLRYQISCLKSNI